jgi:hypothetical protein
MKKLLLGMLLVASLPTTALAARDDLDEIRDSGVNKSEWRMTKNDRMREIKVFVKNEEGKNIRSFRVEAMFDSPIEDLARVQGDVENYQKWYFEVREVKFLKKVSDKEFIFYMVHNAPVGLPDRDVVMRAVIEPMNARRPYVTIRMSALPDYLPPKPPLVRMEAENYVVKWTPMGPNRTKLEAEGYIDPGGITPAWAVNFVQGKGPYANMIGMGRMLSLPKYKDKDQKDPNPYKFFE